VVHQLDTQVAAEDRQTGEQAELVELELTEVEIQTQVVTALQELEEAVAAVVATATGAATVEQVL
jgi:hypothetical protein